MSRSLPAQISAITHVIALARREASPEIVANAEDGLATLQWLSSHSDLIREVRRLMLEHPAVVAVLREFPETKVAVNV